MMHSTEIRSGTRQSSEVTCGGTCQSSLTCRNARELWRVPLQVTARGACLLLWVASQLCSPALADEPAASPEQLDFFDQTRLTRRHLGRDFRLTDVYGSVVKEILA